MKKQQDEQEKGKLDPTGKQQKKGQDEECGKCQDPMAKPDKAESEAVKESQEVAEGE